MPPLLFYLAQNLRRRPRDVPAALARLPNIRSISGFIFPFSPTTQQALSGSSSRRAVVPVAPGRVRLHTNAEPSPITRQTPPRSYVATTAKRIRGGVKISSSQTCPRSSSPSSGFVEHHQVRIHVAAAAQRVEELIAIDLSGADDEFSVGVVFAIASQDSHPICAKLF